jgi:hypothetical protein
LVSEDAIMKLFAVARPRTGVDAPREKARSGVAELRVLWGLYRGGVVLEMYSPASLGAVLILQPSAALCVLFGEQR